MISRFRHLLNHDARDCEEVRELFTDYVDGELDGDGRERVDEHVGFCPPCRQVLANLRHTLERLRHLGETPSPIGEDEGWVADRVRSAWRERA